MFDCLEICLLLAAVALLCCAMTPPLRSCRFLFFGGQRAVIDQRAVSASWQHAWQISGRENV
jgi:hypothetical protein